MIFIKQPFIYLPLIVSLLMGLSCSVQAQITAADCKYAVDICTNADFSITPNGVGEINEIPPIGSFGNPSNDNPGGSGNFGCLRQNEKNSTWMIITIDKPGSLEFSFGEGKQAGYYDWIMYPYSSIATCAQILADVVAPVRCNWNGSAAGGTGCVSVLPTGGSSSNFEPPLDVKCGEKYIFCFSNFSNMTSSVPLLFGGTASVNCHGAAKVIVPPVAVCSKDSVTINASGADSFTWSPPIGLAKTSGAMVNASPATTTNYKVVGRSGCLSDSTQVTVTVNPIPTISNNTAFFCTGNTAILDAGAGYSGYLWSTGETSQTISVGIAGAYTYKVKNASGCWSANANYLVSQKSIPIVHLGNDTLLCQKTGFTLDAGNAGSTYKWGTGETTRTYTPSVTGNYMVTVSNGFCSSTSSIKITLIPLEKVELGNDTNICIGQSLVLNGLNAASTHLWSTGETSQTITVNSSGSYWVEVSELACKVFDTIKVTTVAYPVVSLQKDTTICQKDIITLDAGNAGLQYLWSTGASTQKINASKPITYTVTVSDRGCASVKSMNLSQSPPQNIFLGNDTSICAGGSIELNAMNVSSNHLWSTGETTDKIIVSNPGTYWVRVDNGLCTVYDTIKINKYNYPIVGLIHDTTICANDSALLDAQNAGCNFLWSTGEQSQSIYITKPGTYWYFVSNHGCVRTDTINILSNPSPIINLKTDTSFCKGDSLILDIGPGFKSYKWSDGTTTEKYKFLVGKKVTLKVESTNNCWSLTDSIKVSVVNYPFVELGKDTSFCSGDSLLLNAGNYADNYHWLTGENKQYLTVKDEGRYHVEVTKRYCTTHDSIYVKVIPKPLHILPKTESICLGDILVLDAKNPGDTYIWSTGATVSAINATTAGTYWVKVNNSYCFIKDTLMLKVINYPNVNLGNDTTICMGQTLVLDTKYPALYNYWSTKDSTSTLKVKSPGNYKVRVSDHGCDTQDSIKVFVTPNQPVNLGRDTTLCFGDTLLLDGGNSGFKHLWSTNDTTITLRVGKAGKYWVRVSDKHCVLSDTAIINVVPYPQISIGKDTTICSGIPYTLRGGKIGTAYKWSTGSIKDSIQVLDSGIYAVTVTNVHCISSKSVQIKLATTPWIELGKDTVFCRGTITLNAGNSGTNYLWNTNATTQKITIDSAGTYFVQVMKGFCKNMGLIKIEDIKPIVNLGNDTSLCGKKGFILDAGNSGSNYTWSTGSLLQTIAIGEGEQHIWVEVNNRGCISTDTIHISECTNLIIDVPTAFSPNNDNHNDVLHLVGSHVEEVDFKIFNRFGELVFHSTNFNQGWDGTYNGQQQESDVYIYLLNATYTNGKKVEKKGNITLLR